MNKLFSKCFKSKSFNNLNIKKYSIITSEILKTISIKNNQQSIELTIDINNKGVKKFKYIYSAAFILATNIKKSLFIIDLIRIG